MRIKIINIMVICLSLVFCASAQKKLEEQRAEDPAYQYNMGLFYLNNNQVEEAVKYFNKALTLKPNYDLALCGLGLANSMKGDLRESMKYFQKCLQVNPALTEAHNYLGVVYQEMGFIDKAEEEFKKVFLDKNYHSKELAYYNLSRLYFSQERFEKALDYAQLSTKENIRFAMGYNLQGLIHERLENLPQAIKSYEKALRIAKNEVNFSYNLAIALFKNGEFTRAKDIFEKISPNVTDPDMREKINQYLNVINKK
jgi:tetratricopeptide (TPR) repeat protein